MNKPKMILFDYGQTLVSEKPFDGVAGTRAVLGKCVINTDNITAEEIQLFANEMMDDIGRKPGANDSLIEVHNHSFQNYLYDHFGLERTVSPFELETVFWDAAAPVEPTEHIEEFLLYLKSQGIRTAVISNISFSGKSLENRINTLLSQNDFEFIMATSEYIFRKPHRKIFELAARKARLAPCDMWYCGDNGVCDVDGAKAAGFFPVWYKGALMGRVSQPQSECLTIGGWREMALILRGGNG